MTGYMSVLKNNVFDGRFTNGTGAEVSNGMLLVADATGKKLVKPTADTTKNFVAVEKTTIFGDVPAVEVLVAKAPTVQYYFVENQFDINDSAAYDTTAYTVSADADTWLRAHPIEVGERFYVSAGTLAAGTSYGVLGTGLLG